MSETSAVLNETADELKTEAPKVEESEAFLNLKAKLSNAYKERDEAKKFAKQYEGVDLEAAKEALAARDKAERDKLKDEGNIAAIEKAFEERLAAAEKAAQEKVDAALAEKDNILSTLKNEHLANVLAKKGVDPKRVNGLVRLVGDEVELVAGERGFSLKSTTGVIGDEAEFNALIDKWKQSPDTDYFFQPTVSPGSGASGSDGRSGGGKTITLAQYEANPMQYAAQLASRELTVVD